MKRTPVLLAAVTATALLISGCSAGGDTDAGGDQQLNMFGWAGEIPQSVIDAFEEETGIEVTFDTFDSNETMISRLAAGGSGFDIVEPSQYAVQLLVGQDLLQPLDHDRIEGLDNIMDKFLDPTFDPGNEYSVPWVWGTTGILYNEDCTGGEAITSWDSFWDEQYSGKILMLDNMLAAYIAGLQSIGYSANSTVQAEIEAATQQLIDQRPLLAGYNSTNYAELVAAGDACMAMAWGGASTAQAVAENPNVHYTLPEEGGTLWVDNFAIAADAPNVDAAYEWINFTLRPEIAAMLTNDGSQATVNQAAMEQITDQATLENPAIFAPDDQLENAEFIVDPGEALQWYVQGWTEVRAS